MTVSSTLHDTSAMRAFQVAEAHATPSFADVVPPLPGDGEVVIDVAACGLNFADLLMIAGTYQDTPPYPVTLGMEVAGRVATCGRGVTGLQPGDRVAAFTGSGGLAPQCRAQAARCVHLPDGLPFDTAAGILVAYGTSHLALVHRAGLRAGETLVVLGAAGGVGLTAVEIGAALGARVVAVARGAEKAAIARAAGAQDVIDSDAPDLRTRLKGMGGVDVVYDTVGDPAGSQALRACRPGGRFLAIGFAGGTVPQVPLNYLLVKNLSIHGLNWSACATLDPAVFRASLGTLMDWIGAGRLRPRIGHTLPFARAGEGLDLLRRREAKGKVVVTL